MDIPILVVVPESTTSIGFARLHIGVEVSVSASLVIRDDFSFQVHMQGHQLQTQLRRWIALGLFLGLCLTSASSRLCCGNQDA